MDTKVIQAASLFWDITKQISIFWGSEIPELL